MSAFAANLRRWRMAVATHDVENPTHESHGIGLAFFDLERLGLEDGEELWPGYTVQVDGKASGNFRVLCDTEHPRLTSFDAKFEKPVDAVTRERELTPA